MAAVVEKRAEIAAPFVKYAGGKTQLLPELRKRVLEGLEARGRGGGFDIVKLTADHKRVLAMFDKDPKHWLNGDDAWILIDLIRADLVTLHSVIAQRKGWR